MISILFLISYFRVPKEVGKIYYLPKCDDDNINNFLKSSSINIVIFANNLSQFEFTNLGIYKYDKIFNFSVSTQETAKKLNIDKFPSIAQFHKDQFHSYFRGYHNSISFIRWCKEIRENESKIQVINEFEELRLLFESRSTFLLGVNNMEPPKDYKNDIKFVTVRSNLFSFFNLSVSSGYYIYRGLDRQLIEVTRNYRSYAHSLLVDVEKDNIQKRPYFCGYFMDILNSYTSTLEISILQKLANKRKDMFFGPLFGTASSFMATFGQLDFIKYPYLVVWNTSDVSNHRWTLFDNTTMHDISKIESFLDEIVSGNKPFNAITEEIDSKDKDQIVNSNFFDKLKSQDRHTIVLFTTSKKGKEYPFYRIFLASKSILPDISFLTFDLTQNDIPEGIPQPKVQPAFLLFKKGSTDPISLRMGNSFKEFIKDLVDNLDDVKLPDVDYQQIQTTIHQDIRKNNKY